MKPTIWALSWRYTHGDELASEAKLDFQKKAVCFAKKHKLKYCFLFRLPGVFPFVTSGIGTGCWSGAPVMTLIKVTLIVKSRSSVPTRSTANLLCCLVLNRHSSMLLQHGLHLHKDFQISADHHNAVVQVAGQWVAVTSSELYLGTWSQQGTFAEQWPLWWRAAKFCSWPWT